MGGKRVTEGCPVRTAVGILDGKWTLLIIKELLSGARRFGQLQHALAGISPKMLTQRLKMLEDQGVIWKCVYPEVPLKVEYGLTDPETLRPVITALKTWGMHIQENQLEDRKNPEKKHEKTDISPMHTLIK